VSKQTGALFNWKWVIKGSILYLYSQIKACLGLFFDKQMFGNYLLWYVDSQLFGATSMLAEAILFLT